MSFYADHWIIVQVTFVEALDQLMPGFDPEIGKLAQRVLINPRKIDYHTGVFASKVIYENSSLHPDVPISYLNFVAPSSDNSSKGWKTSDY